MTKNQILTELQSRCVNGAGIAYEYIGTEQYNPAVLGPDGLPSQTAGTAVVKKYRFYGTFPEGQFIARVRAVNFFVQDEGLGSEAAYIEPDTIGGIWKGEVEAYLDTLNQVLSYEVIKSDLTKNTATAKVAVADGLTPAGTKIVEAFVRKVNNVFSYNLISSGTW